MKTITIIATIILTVGSILTGTPAGFIPSQAALNGSQGSLTLAERVAYQRAIEDVYWRHRIWPKENSDPKPSLDAVMSQAQLENKVAAYLRNSLALEHYGRPITADQLQAEMDRMAWDTKRPEVLRELFETLGNDPAVIAECLARPILAKRLIGDLSAQDQTRVESPRTDGISTMSVATTLGQVVYTLPTIADTCTDDTWTATNTTSAPINRWDHTAVWTGTEMIVWGGWDGYNYLNTGWIYNPATDSWTATSTTNAPTGSGDHTAVWTGSEMIVWGGGAGFNFFNTGGKYNPSTDSWTATNITNAPEGRFLHTAVWTGSEMIIWGGRVSMYCPLVGNTGGRYNPNTDSWTATSTTNAPDARVGHTAVWTGSEMVVWGGSASCPGGVFNTGGRYNPSTDSWTATGTSSVPTARTYHTAVWTGNKMIVWGGVADQGVILGSGGKYDPSTDSWTATSSTNAPAARYANTAVWTGSEMIIWGGGYNIDNGNYPVFWNDGGRYDPVADSWTATSLTNETPSQRARQTAVWTGSEMIIWGGQVYGPSYIPGTGGRYCAATPTPSPTPTPTATPTPTPTATVTPTATPRPRPSPRPRPTPRPNPTPAPRPTP